MNISLPEELKDFVDEQVKRGYGTSSEYVRELIRKDQDRLHLRELLLAGQLRRPPHRPMRATSRGCAAACARDRRPATGGDCEADCPA